MTEDMKDKPEEYWKQKLTPEQYHSLREKGTEVPGTGKYLETYDKGVYMCAACGNVLFDSGAKYESTIPGLIGWPSFSKGISSDAVELVADSSYGMERTEAICANCGSHLGHIFDDNTSATGQHYCINSASLDFVPNKEGDTNAKS